MTPIVSRRLRASVLLISSAGAGCAVADPGLDGSHITSDAADETRYDGRPDSNDARVPREDVVASDSTTAPDTRDVDAAGDSGEAALDDSAPDDSAPDASALCVPASVVMCASPLSLGSISGDKGGDVVTSTGYEAQWLQVTVSENDSGLFGTDLRALLTLTSTTGHNFDLFVYQGRTKGDGGGVECTTVAGSATSTGGTAVVPLKWKDNQPIGGSDDSRVLSIEVRPATGTTCSTSFPWSLTIAGNR